MSAENKGVYADEEANKGEFDFEPTFDDPSTMNLKTACCCCLCGVDDCADFMQVQGKGVCLWLEYTEGAKCCQCADESSEALACVQGTNKLSCCSMTDQEQSMICCQVGAKGVCCCCMTGQGNGSCCSPIGAPESCLKCMGQFFCIHLRSALPCDDDVPFEIGCCGVMCKEREGASSAHE